MGDDGEHVHPGGPVDILKYRYLTSNPKNEINYNSRGERIGCSMRTLQRRQQQKTEDDTT